MELRKAITERRSIRGFLSKPVSKDILKDVLAMAQRAVSAVNYQPWEFAIVSGEAIEMLRKDNIDALIQKEKPDYVEHELYGKYKDRQRTLGKALFTKMGIGREDKEARMDWLIRGFRFFDAPVVIFVLTDAALDREDANLNLGAVIQNIILAAMEHGLGTCVETQAVMYERILREDLDISDDKRIVIGIAIGYPDPEFPANQVVSEREPIDEICEWYGF